MPASPSIRTTWPSPAFGLLVERAELRELVLPAVDRRLPRDADAPEGALRLGPERLGARPSTTSTLSPSSSTSSELRGRGEPLLPVLREQRVDHLLEERRELRVQLAEPARLLVQHLPQDLRRRRPRGRDAAPSTARRGAGRGRGGRRGRRGPHRRPGTAPAPRSGASPRTPRSGESRIASSASRATPRSMILTSWSGGDEDVLGLEVAVDDAGLVDGGEPLRDLAADVAAELLGDPLQLLEEVAERLALDVLHDEEVLLRALDEERVAVVGCGRRSACRTAFPISASRRNRLKKPGVSRRCGWTTFSATRLPAFRPGALPATSARNTRPMPPLPRSPRIRYEPRRTPCMGPVNRSGNVGTRGGLPSVRSGTGLHGILEHDGPRSTSDTRRGARISDPRGCE